MSPKSAEYAIEILPLDQSQFLPGRPAPGDTPDSAYARHIQSTIPSFAQRVAFALVELERLDWSEARIFVYAPGAAVEETVAEYIKLTGDEAGAAEALLAALRSIPEVHFSDMVLCARIRNPDAVYQHGSAPAWQYRSVRRIGVGAEARKELKSREWHDFVAAIRKVYADDQQHATRRNDTRHQERLEEIRRKTATWPGRVSASSECSKLDVIQIIFHAYVEDIAEAYLARYPYSFVLFVPLALDSIDPAKGGTCHKLGSVLIHLGCFRDLADRELLDAFAKVQLFWYRFFASEVLEKQRRELASAQAQADILKLIESPLLDIRAGMTQIQDAFLNLEWILSPITGMVFGGKSVEAFFGLGAMEEPMTEEIQVKTHHTFDPEEPYECRELAAAVFLKALGAPQISVPLWQSFREFLANPPERKKRLVEAMIETSPVLRLEDPAGDDAEEVFELAKDWFHGAYKPGVGLKFSLLRVALRAVASRCELDFPARGEMRVLSVRPIDTIDALAALDAEFDMRSAAGRVWDEGNAVQLGLGFANSLPQKEHLTRLLRDYSRAVDAAGKGAHPRRGSMLYVLWQLFGGSHAFRRRQSIRCERDDLIATLVVKGARQAEITWTRR